jgi:hypothetical protein
MTDMSVTQFHCTEIGNWVRFVFPCASQDRGWTKLHMVNHFTPHILKKLLYAKPNRETSLQDRETLLLCTCYFVAASRCVHEVNLHEISAWLRNSSRDEKHGRCFFLYICKVVSLSRAMLIIWNHLTLKTKSWTDSLFLALNIYSCISYCKKPSNLALRFSLEVLNYDFSHL